MAWILRDEEIRAVLSLDGKKRYSYCLAKVADGEQLWSLWEKDGWALTENDEGNEAIPVWPHEEFASLCANGTWNGCQPKPIEVRIWLERWIPGMEKDGRLVAVFPIPEHSGVVVTPRRMAQDLRAQLAKYD